MNYCLEYHIGYNEWLTSNACTFARLFDGKFGKAFTDFYRITKFIYIKL